MRLKRVFWDFSRAQIAEGRALIAVAGRQRRGRRGFIQPREASLPGRANADTPRPTRILSGKGATGQPSRTAGPRPG